MALEINEIAIRIGVREENGETEPRPPQQQENFNYEEIVEDCVRRVLQTLKTMGDR